MTTRKPVVKTAALAVLLALALVGCGSSGSPSHPAAHPAARAVSLDRVSTVLPAQVGNAWILTDVEGAGTSQGELQLNNTEGAEAKINWRKADQHQSYLEDRADLGAARPLTVLGKPGQMFTYSADDHTVIRPVEGKAFLEIRVDGVSEAAFMAFVDSLGAVDAQRWAAVVRAAPLG
ncbi:MAG: hypothetical protein ACJ72E_15415 [Marmoricola sp.]